MLAARLPPGRRRLWPQRLRKGAYLVALLLVGIFLWRQGRAPWSEAIRHWQVTLLAMLSTGAGLIVQALAFRSALPASGGTIARGAIPLRRLIHIWAVSAAASVVAPLFAGLATRTALLLRDGLSFAECLAGSSRQVWMGLEFALLFAALSLPLLPALPNAPLFALGAATAWLALFGLRQCAAHGARMAGTHRLGRLMRMLGSRLPASGHPWFALQIVLMALTYFLAFGGMGVPLDLPTAIALAALTVILSLIVFVPNGLGITDALWIFVAAQSGQSLESAVAIAINIRLAHLLAALTLSALTRAKAAH
jgi:uncharacterized membrane protein YbhN (UPF0104 family)